MIILYVHVNDDEKRMKYRYPNTVVTIYPVNAVDYVNVAIRTDRNCSRIAPADLLPQFH